jgi:hypothetical protein
LTKSDGRHKHDRNIGNGTLVIEKMEGEEQSFSRIGTPGSSTASADITPESGVLTLRGRFIPTTAAV